MAHRIFRLSISPDDAPDVRRVIELDGRSSLADVHEQIVTLYRLDDSDHLYAFFTSGRYWDKQTAYFDPRTDGPRADRALLFRLKLTAGQSCAYLLDFGTEQRFVVTVVAVRDVESPLSEPQLIEAVGEVGATSDDAEEREAPDDAPAELAELVVLAEAFLDANDELDELEGEPADLPDATAPILQASAEAALAMLRAVGDDSKLFFQLDEWLLERSLSVRLLDLPLALAQVSAFEPALALARALVFVDRELMEGDLAIVLAKAGRRDEALAQLDLNLAQAKDAVLVEAKAGETHRALGDLPAAEAYFRRSLAEAKTPSERLEGLIRVASCLIDQGRDAEANEVLKAAHSAEAESVEKANPPAVGRNEPCPCGSGKKYKKCHG
jgi:tetratricopeptide (TPR) repeat protein